MKEQRIKVLMVEPGEHPKITYLDNNLRALQKAVSIGADYTGLIEILSLDDTTCILCNEEGKLIGLEPNRRLGDDVLCGVFYVVDQNKHGDLTSLSEEAIQTCTERFYEPEDIEDSSITLIIDFEIY